MKILMNQQEVYVYSLYTTNIPLPCDYSSPKVGLATFTCSLLKEFFFNLYYEVPIVLSVCLSVCLSVYPRFTLEQLKLDPQIHIYLESVSPGKHYEHVYMATPTSVFLKIGTFCQKKNGVRPTNPYI